MKGMRMRICRGKRPKPSQTAGTEQPLPETGRGSRDPEPGTAVLATDAPSPRAPAAGTRRARRAHRGTRLRLGLLGLAALSALLLAGPGATASVGSNRAGIHVKGPAPVGALFTWVDGKAVRHFCTATVINSRRGDLVLTAAHCVYTLKLGTFVFAPGWYKGKFPYGTWPVTAVYVDKAWSAQQNPNDDFAILIAGRAGTHIQKHTGAETLREFQSLPVSAQVIGYPDSSNEPVTCTNTARAFDTSKLHQIKFWCGGYTDGTSGGPFLIDVSSKTGTGDVIGDIGGYQLGGDVSYISYSPQYRSAIQELYETANSRK
jgi:Trypsin